MSSALNFIFPISVCGDTMRPVKSRGAPMESKKPVRRSQAWFGKNDRDGFVHRSWIKNQGYPHDELDGRPVIGICNTWSELTPCNGHFRELAEFVKRGVYEAGGFPLEFPVMSLGETQLRPTAMLFRNLASMDVEESIRANPIDGVVLLMGCDKTTPSLIMGAASCDLPTIGISGGPMLSGHFRGRQIGSGTGVWQMSEDVRAGRMTQEEFTAAESCMHRSKGPCMTMGWPRRWRAWWRRSASHCPATPRSRPLMRAAIGSRSSRAGASSRWWKKTSSCPGSSRARPSRMPSGPT